MSADELDWQKNVKPLKCEKVILNQPTSKFVHDEKFSEETHNSIFGASFSTKKIELHKRSNIRPLSKPIYGKKFLEEVQVSTVEYLDAFEERSSASTTKLPSEIEFRKRPVDYQIHMNNSECDHSFFSQKSSPYTDSSFSLDHNTKLKVDRGQYFIGAKLDLHGCNIDDAYYKLMGFIIKNYQIDNRCLLVITGHGNSTNKVGAIKNNLHKWLNDTKIYHMVLYFQQATKKHGGKGAFYVLLRRNKNLETTSKK